MSGNSEKIVIVEESEKPVIPVCVCGSKRWCIGYEAWEYVSVEECDGDYYLEKEDASIYTGITSPWKCLNCGVIALPPQQEILREIANKWAEWE